jgi:hypothetical protein
VDISGDWLPFCFHRSPAVSQIPFLFRFTGGMTPDDCSSRHKGRESSRVSTPNSLPGEGKKICNSFDQHLDLRC